MAKIATLEITLHPLEEARKQEIIQKHLMKAICNAGKEIAIEMAKKGLEVKDR